MCCSAIQCVAVCCSVLQCDAVCCSVLQCVALCCIVLQCVAVYHSVLQCVAVCCSVAAFHELQYEIQHEITPSLLRVDLNPLKKKATSSEVRNVMIDFPTLFLKWYQKHVKVRF